MKNERKERRGLTGERLDEHVNTLVAVLVPTGGEEVQSVVQIEVVVTVEMATYEIVDLLLGDSVKVLELVHCGELGDVQTVGEDSICESGIMESAESQESIA